MSCVLPLSSVLPLTRALLSPQCPIEWFHYGCVGLTEAPKGKWFCPQCTAAMKRRGSRHK